MNMPSDNQTREEIVAQIKERADIVQVIGQHVDLKKSGARFLGLCPFHGEKTASFSVHPGQQFFHCFGCGESGDVFSFLMKYHNMDFPAALKELAGRYNIALPEAPRRAEDELRQKRREELFRANETAARTYHHYLLSAPGGDVARRYLQTRGVSQALIDRFRIGYAPGVEAEGWNFLGSHFGKQDEKAGVDAGLLVAKEKGGTYDRFRDRIVFPIADISGRICGFGGRIVGDGQPKYLNSPESLVFNKSKMLLGLYQQKEEIRKQNHVVMVEGNFDLISLVNHGLPNVIAPLGTAVTREQLRLLKRFAAEVTLLFDGDEAGVKAAIRSAPLFLAEQVNARIAILPTGQDPDTYIRSKGRTALLSLLSEARGLPEFLFEYWQNLYGLSLEGKSKLVEELRPLVAAAPSPLQRSVFIAHFAGKLGLPVEELQRNLLNIGNLQNVHAQSMVERTIVQKNVHPLSLAQKQLLAFLILQPHCFSKLSEAGVRECLQESVGEVIFLQLQQLLESNPNAEPEDLLSALPDGPEREIVAQVLMNGHVRKGDDENIAELQELAEHIAYLQKLSLQKKSQNLLVQMQRAQDDGDMAQLEKLMQEKMLLAKRLHDDKG